MCVCVEVEKGERGGGGQGAMRRSGLLHARRSRGSPLDTQEWINWIPGCKREGVVCGGGGWGVDVGGKWQIQEVVTAKGKAGTNHTHTTTAWLVGWLVVVKVFKDD